MKLKTIYLNKWFFNSSFIVLNLINLFFRYVYYTENLEIKFFYVTISNILIVTFIAIFVLLKVFKVGLREKDIIPFLIIVSIFFLSIIFQNFQIDYFILLFWSLIYLVPNKDNELLVGLIFTKVIFVITILLLNRLGYFMDVENIKYDTNQLVGHSYGFIHANSLGVMILSIIIGLAILLKSKWLNILLLFIISLLLNNLTQSRTSFFIAFAVVITFVFKNYLSSKIISKKLMSCGLLAIFSFSILLPYIYKYNLIIINKMNSYTNNRIYLGNYYIQTYGFNFFPKNIQRIQIFRLWDHLDYYIDNFYLSYLLSNGVIISIVLMILIIYITSKFKFNAHNGILLLLSFMILFLENFSLNVFLFTPFIYGLISEDLGS